MDYITHINQYIKVMNSITQIVMCVIFVIIVESLLNNINILLNLDVKSNEIFRINRNDIYQS